MPFLSTHAFSPVKEALCDRKLDFDGGTCRRGGAFRAFQSTDWLAADSRTAGSTAACRTRSKICLRKDLPFLIQSARPLNSERFSASASRPVACFLFRYVMGASLCALAGDALQFGSESEFVAQ